MPALPAMRERPLGDDQPEHLLLVKPETEKAVDRDNRQPALDHLGEFGVGTCGPGDSDGFKEIDGSTRHNAEHNTADCRSRREGFAIAHRAG